jgi:hypothetical protein
MYQLREQIKGTKPKKSSAGDHITMRFVKENQAALEPLILSIVHSVIKTSQYPDKLKASRIIPLLERGKVPTDPRSYRPINILPTISKLIEKHMATTLTAHLEANNLIPGQHHGGRAFHSTTTAVTTLMDNWSHQVQNKNRNAVIILD